MTKEKPIIFNTPMVQAIYAGTKIQTRRVMKPQPRFPDGKYRYDGVLEGIHAVELLNDMGKPTEHYYSCGNPRYLPGDTLWVREIWGFDTGDDDEYGTGSFIYRADNGEEPPNGRWKPSIHMPREAARLFLLVTDVRAERLQEISEDDAHAEGMDSPSYPIIQFKDLWNDLNAHNDYGWDANPWVWVYTFDNFDDL